MIYKTSNVMSVIAIDQAYEQNNGRVKGSKEDVYGMSLDGVGRWDLPSVAESCCAGAGVWYGTCDAAGDRGRCRDLQQELLLADAGWA